MVRPAIQAVILVKRTDPRAGETTYLLTDIKRGQPAAERGLAIGIFVCAVNLTAYGVDAPLTGKINDLLGAATNPGMMLRFSDQPRRLRTRGVASLARQPQHERSQ